MTHAAAALPEDTALSLLEGQAAALPPELSALAEKRRAAEDTRRAAEDARAAWEAHPLYPDDAAALERRADAIVPEKAPSPFLPFFTGSLVVVATVLAFLIRSRGLLPFCLFLTMAGLGVISTLLAVKFRRQAIVERKNFAAQQRAALEDQIAEYLPLRQQAADDAEAARRARALAVDAEDSCRARVTALLAQVRRFAPEAAGLSDAQTALAEMRRRRSALTAAQQQAREAALYRDALRGQLTEAELSQPAAIIAPDTAEDVTEALAQAQQALTEARRRYDTLLGRIRALDSSSDLTAQLSQKQEELARLQEEYDAIALAMTALEQANTTLQNRFSPALSRRAGELFSRLTGGKYESVLLDRTFSAQAGETGESVSHDAQLLSLGTLDQLYLAVRLAICESALPANDPPPIVLDDALVRFDDERCRAALELLLEESKSRQILLFTCQHRESAYLSGRDGVTFLSL